MRLRGLHLPRGLQLRCLGCVIPCGYAASAQCPQITLPPRWLCLLRQTQPNSSIWIDALLPRFRQKKERGDIVQL